MKRIFAFILVALAAVTLLAGVVHVVLVAAHVSEPAATTVYGPTTRRLWATTVVGLALAGVVIGGLAVSRTANRLTRVVALVAGLIEVVNGTWLKHERDNDIDEACYRLSQRHRLTGGRVVPVSCKGWTGDERG